MELGNMLLGNSRGEFEIEDRMTWQQTLIDFLDKIIGIDYNGNFYTKDESLKKYYTKRGGFENDIFSINPYYWGNDEEIMDQPNFVYKPTGFEIQWYKYPMRDSYMNKNITIEVFVSILVKCFESLDPIM